MRQQRDWLTKSEADTARQSAGLLIMKSTIRLRQEVIPETLAKDMCSLRC
jgi:hypothetical protein